MSKYRKSVIVNVVRPTKPLMLGDFSKIVFLTDEIDFDIKRYTTLEMMKLYAAMFSITVPGINILLCAWWYVRGARRWNEYVRDL